VFFDVSLCTSTASGLAGSILLVPSLVYWSPQEPLVFSCLVIF
jgi:hypothetical protein